MSHLHRKPQGLAEDVIIHFSFYFMLKSGKCSVAYGKFAVLIWIAKSVIFWEQCCCKAI